MDVVPTEGCPPIGSSSADDAEERAARPTPISVLFARRSLSPSSFMPVRQRAPPRSAQRTERSISARTQVHEYSSTTDRSSSSRPLVPPATSSRRDANEFTCSSREGGISNRTRAEFVRSKTRNQPAAQAPGSYLSGTCNGSFMRDSHGRGDGRANIRQDRRAVDRRRTHSTQCISTGPDTT